MMAAARRAIAATCSSAAAESSGSIRSKSTRFRCTRTGRSFHAAAAPSLSSSSLPRDLPFRRRSDDEDSDNKDSTYYSRRTIANSAPGTVSLLRRNYSTTARREILPLVAVGLVAITARYSYKALQRMDSEWEVYEEQLREYKLANGLDPDEELPPEAGASGPSSSAAADAGAAASSSQSTTSTAGTSTASMFRSGTIGIDLGTTSLRIAHKSAGIGEKSHVVVDREGSRATPNSIYFEHDGTAVLGRLASSKMYERVDGVLNPHDLLQAEQDDDNVLPAVEETIRSAARNSLEQTLGKGEEQVRLTDALFAVDSSLSGGYNCRPVYTYPAPSSGHSYPDGVSYQSRYEAAVYNLSSPCGIEIFVHEPVAAILGAVRQGVLPSAPKGTVLVLDVGGSVTAANLVLEDTTVTHGYSVTHSLRLDGFGGETLVDALVSHLCTYFYQSPMRDVKDGMALQRLYDASRAAVMEISGGKDRVQINVPYLSVNDKMEPRHLDVGVSRVVMEHEVKDILKSRSEDFVEQDVLSASMGPPSDLTSLLSSLVMRLLEESGMNPFALEKILIVGGGARSPIVQKAIFDALEQLGGPQLVVKDMLVIPEGGLIEELVVHGAAVAGED